VRNTIMRIPWKHIEGTAWGKQKEKLCLEYELASFAKFKRLGNRQEAWEEVCEDRVVAVLEYGGRQQPLWVNSQRSPEEWGVIGDIELTYCP